MTEVKKLGDNIRYFRQKVCAGCEMHCELIRMGKDYTITVYGGDAPHIGSVVMSTSRPSLTGEGISATSSVLNAVGHKDDFVARKLAEAVAVRAESIAVCSCGIHIDDATVEQLKSVMVACDKLQQAIIAAVDEDLAAVNAN